MFRHPRLPLRITLLLCLVLTITVLNFVRLFTAIAWRSTLSAYMPSPLELYIAVTGAAWALVGLFVLWSFLRGWRGTRLVFLLAAAGYAAWAWADRLVLQAEPRANWQFALALTALLIGYTSAVVLDSRNQSYFRKETYERKPEKPSSS